MRPCPCVSDHVCVFHTSNAYYNSCSPRLEVTELMYVLGERFAKDEWFLRRSTK